MFADKLLGFNWLQFLFQLVNFTIVVILLRRFLFKPLMEVLRERQQRIQKGLELANTAEQMVAEGESKRAEMLEEATNEAEAVKVEAGAAAESAKRDLLARAEEEAREIVLKARETMKAERAKMIEEMRGQLVDLVTIASRKVLGEALTEDELQALVQRAVLSSLESLEDVALPK